MNVSRVFWTVDFLVRFKIYFIFVNMWDDFSWIWKVVTAIVISFHLTAHTCAIYHSILYSSLTRNPDEITYKMLYISVLHFMKLIISASSLNVTSIWIFIRHTWSRVATAIFAKMCSWDKVSIQRIVHIFKFFWQSL